MTSPNCGVSASSAVSFHAVYPADFGNPPALPEKDNSERIIDLRDLMNSHPPAICHPLPAGHLISSPGCHFSYRIIGPCCRLFDREQLPWPCCRLQWRGKEPSWRRIGRRLIVDLATRHFPSYSVEIVGQKPLSQEPLVITLYWVKLPPLIKDWWYADKLKRSTALSPQPPLAAISSVTHLTNSGGADESSTEG